MMNEETPEHGEGMRHTVEHFEGPLVRYAWRITGDLELARDVAQDVFVRLWSADQAEVAEHLAPWLFRVCRNRALDLGRKQQRLREDHERGLPPEAPAAVSPADAAERQEDVRAVMRLLAGLPANQQEVVRLKFQEGLSYREISQVTQLSPTNVGYLIHTAILTLRARMLAADQRPHSL